MNFGRAFTYAFEDPDWLKKVGIVALVFLIPIVGPIVAIGWTLELIRRVINNDPQPLPDWNDFGGFLSTGLKGFVVNLAFVFPIFIFYGCGIALVLATGGISGATSSDNGSSALSGLPVLVMVCMYCFVILYVILASLLIPPAWGILAATGELSAAFRFSELFGLLRAAPAPYLLSVVILGVTGAVLAPIGTLVCFVGIYAVIAYLYVVSGHLYAQAYNIAKAAQNAAPIEPVAGV